MDLCEPVGIILVTAGSRGQKVLFRYPCQLPREKERQEKGNFNIANSTSTSRTGLTLYVSCKIGAKSPLLEGIRVCLVGPRWAAFSSVCGLLRSQDTEPTAASSNSSAVKCC